MLFRKKLPRDCRYCVYGTLMDENTILCIKRGVRSLEKKPCRKFSYDPCKRIPPRAKAPDFEKYKEDDFIL